MSRLISSHKKSRNSQGRPFAEVSLLLAKVGCISIEHYLTAPSDEPDDLILTAKSFANEPSPPPEPVLIPEEKPAIAHHGLTRAQTVIRLHTAAQRIFGATEAIRYEFLQEEGPNNKQCILTITRPNGASRSYATEAKYTKKNDAKIQAAQLAIDMGALDFIANGDTESTKSKKSLVLAPLSVEHHQDSYVEGELIAAPGDHDPHSQQIEDCCTEWRAGTVKPLWVNLVEPKVALKQGCALRISLTPHSSRTYSSELTYNRLQDAKKVCAKMAIEQGILEFIKFGDGQKEPLVIDDDVDESSRPLQVAKPTYTLQTFYDSLPKPFPESFDDKSAVEINAPAWINQLIQQARGGRFSVEFVFTQDPGMNIHGCVLRLVRPEETRTYMVEARFPKKSDAKSAVCLQAMSEKVGAYVRDVARKVEQLVPPELRDLAAHHIFTALSMESNSIYVGNIPRYEFTRDKEAYGCDLTVQLVDNPSPEQKRTYSAPPQFRTKNDAKVYVVWLAAQSGVFDFLRCRGGEVLEPIPVEIDQDFEAIRKYNHRKRKLQEDAANGYKKIKVEAGDVSLAPSGSKIEVPVKPVILGPNVISPSRWGRGTPIRGMPRGPFRGAGGFGFGGPNGQPLGGRVMLGNSMGPPRVNFGGLNAAMPQQPRNFQPGSYPQRNFGPFGAPGPIQAASQPAPYPPPRPAMPHAQTPPVWHQPSNSLPPQAPLHNPQTARLLSQRESSYGPLPPQQHPLPPSSAFQGPSPYQARPQSNMHRTLPPQNAPHDPQYSVPSMQRAASNTQEFQEDAHMDLVVTEVKTSPPRPSRFDIGPRGSIVEAPAKAKPSATQPISSKGPRTAVGQLEAFCKEKGMNVPEFFDKVVKKKTARGVEDAYTVWAVHGTRKFALNDATFESFSEGRERVAKAVLKTFKEIIG